MLNNFPEFIETCIVKIKSSKPVEDEWGNITFPTIDKSIECVVKHSVSAFKEVSLGYAVDLVLYTEEQLEKANNVFYEGKEYIVKRIEKKREHWKTYLVMKNV